MLFRRYQSCSSLLFSSCENAYLIDHIHKSHAAPVGMYTCLFWMVHCGIWDRCSVAFVRHFPASRHARIRQFLRSSQHSHVCVCIQPMTKTRFNVEIFVVEWSICTQKWARIDSTYAWAVNTLYPRYRDLGLYSHSFTRTRSHQDLTLICLVIHPVGMCFADLF